METALRAAETLPRVLCFAVLTCCVAVSGPNETRAQSQGRFPGAAADRHQVGGELKLGILLAEQALGVLQSAGDSEQLKRADALTIRSYVQWNRAKQAVQLLRARQTVEDPLLQLTEDTIDQTRVLTSQAHSHIEGAAADESERAINIATAVQLLLNAIAVAQQAMDLV